MVEIDIDKEKIVKDLRMEATIGSMGNKNIDIKLKAERKTNSPLQKFLKENEEELSRVQLVQLVHYSEEPKIFKCDQCEKDFVIEALL